MKIIKAIRGGKATPIILKSGDKYDSRMLLYDQIAEYECPVLIDVFENCNTDPSVRYIGKSGILAERVYAFICTETKKLGKSLLLFDNQFFNLVNNIDDMTEQMQELPSLIPNPNHNNKKILTADFVHKGGTTEWDYSMGCVTIHGDDYDRFIKNFKLNEKGLFELTRNPNWKPPFFYQNK